MANSKETMEVFAPKEWDDFRIGDVVKIKGENGEVDDGWKIQRFKRYYSSETGYQYFAVLQRRERRMEYRGDGEKTETYLLMVKEAPLEGLKESNK